MQSEYVGRNSEPRVNYASVGALTGLGTGLLAGGGLFIFTGHFAALLLLALGALGGATLGLMREWSRAGSLRRREQARGVTPGEARETATVDRAERALPGQMAGA